MTLSILGQTCLTVIEGHSLLVALTRSVHCFCNLYHAYFIRRKRLHEKCHHNVSVQAFVDALQHKCPMSIHGVIVNGWAL